MIRHTLKIALRNIYKHLNYSILNVLGLAIGLASFIFIFIFIADELSYDRFHENHDKIYRVNRLYNSNDINEDAATCSFPFAPALQEDYPDLVKATCRLFDFQVKKLMFEYQKDEENSIKFNEEWFYLADSNVFKIFTFPFIEGDPETALDRPNTIVITKSTARRYFGDESAIGKILRVEEQVEVEITGVIQDIPRQSHFTIDILGSMSTFREMQGGQMPQTWIWNPCWTYVLLHDHIDPGQLEARFDDFYLAHYPDFQNQDITLYLQPLKDIHLKSHHEYEMHPNGKITYVRILLAIAIFVLILACINFMNLSTASSAGRTKEISMKKVSGARQSQLRIQFLGEAFIMTAIALLIALVIVELGLPYFNNFTGKDIPGNQILSPAGIISAIVLLFTVGIISGSYPAFFLSSLDTSRLRELSGKSVKSGLGRKILVVVQFLISIALIIGTVSAYSQLNYMRNADIGFNKDQVIVVPSTFAMGTRFDAFAEELRKHNEIKYVTGMEDVLGVNHNTRSFTFEGMFDDQAFYYPAFMVRYEFLETFDIQVVAGRGFSRKYPADTLDAIMINESMASHLGWTNEEAIGKNVRSDGNEKVIGVFNDFNALSLHKPAGNFILDMVGNPQGAAALTRYIAVKVNSTDYNEVLDYIEGVWETFVPTRPFEFTFMDEQLDALYKDEQKFSELSIILTILAIIIASLGLIGLTSFLVEKKTKEISVRRVHGASVIDLNNMLSKEFLILIGIAILISWPLAYFSISRWLENFDKHISLTWVVFVISGFITLILTIGITSLHALRASRVNPADTLKYE